LEKGDNMSEFLLGIFTGVLILIIIASVYGRKKK